MSKRLGGIKGCKYKTSSWHLNGFPDGSNIGSTNSIMSGRSPPLYCTLTLIAIIKDVAPHFCRNLMVGYGLSLFSIVGMESCCGKKCPHFVLDPPIAPIAPID